MEITLYLSASNDVCACVSTFGENEYYNLGTDARNVFNFLSNYQGVAVYVEDEYDEEG